MEIPEIERAFAYTPHPGDVLIFEFTAIMRPETVDEIGRQLRQQFGPEIKIVLLDKGIKFVPIIREDASM